MATLSSSACNSFTTGMPRVWRRASAAATPGLMSRIRPPRTRMPRASGSRSTSTPAPWPCRNSAIARVVGIYQWTGCDLGARDRHSRRRRFQTPVARLDMGRHSRLEPHRQPARDRRRVRGGGWCGRVPSLDARQRDSRCGLRMAARRSKPADVDHALGGQVAESGANGDTSATHSPCAAPATRWRLAR